jgi:hypothetical protein
VDYDGDTLSQKVEQKLWKYSTTAANRTLSPLTYSDGLQYSVYKNLAGQGDRRFPALPAAGYAKQQAFINWAQANGYRFNVYVFGGVQYDLFDANLDGVETNGERFYNDRRVDGFLSDEERDEDADGLTNRDENTGRMQRVWWDSCYKTVGESDYYVRYADTELTDADSDGDGVRDGADDQDHDDLPNVMELSRIAAFNKGGTVYADPMEGDGDDTENGAECKLAEAIKDQLAGDEPPVYWHQTAYGRVNPFNPCLPRTDARTCNNYATFGDEWAPYDESPDWFALN